MPDFTVSEVDAGKRADVFLTENMQGCTRASLKSLFDLGIIKVNQKQARAGYKLKGSDVISFKDSMLKASYSAPDLPVIYEDEDVVVINKPAGILTHSKGAISREPTVADFIRLKIHDTNLTGNRAGIVHRLDRGTSGVMIAAKNSESLRFLQKQFSSRRVEKSYIALASGIILPPAAIIDIPIERNPRKPQTFHTASTGKQALTRYRVLKTATVDGSPCSLVELKPQTGRTHQLRVHLAYLGHPVVGDSIYGRGVDHPMMLHAQALKLTLPNGEAKEFTAPLPALFESINERYNNG